MCVYVWVCGCGCVFLAVLAVTVPPITVLFVRLVPENKAAQRRAFRFEATSITLMVCVCVCVCACVSLSLSLSLCMCACVRVCVFLAVLAVTVPPITLLFVRLVPENKAAQIRAFRFEATSITLMVCVCVCVCVGGGGGGGVHVRVPGRPGRDRAPHHRAVCASRAGEQGRAEEGLQVRGNLHHPHGVCVSLSVCVSISVSVCMCVGACLCASLAVLAVTVAPIQNLLNF